jgi:hypothetical protein
MPPLECMVDLGKLKGKSIYQKNSTGTIYKIKINSCGNEVVLYEAIPYSSNDNNKVAIALHQTTIWGKNEVMGFQGDPDLAYGKYFYEQGYTVLAPDVFLAGENYDKISDWDTKDFYNKYPDWSATSRMLFDNLAVSRYASIAHEKKCKIAIGHSLGGFNARFLGAFDETINVVISSGAFESLKFDPRAIEYSRDKWFIYFPLLRPYLALPAPREVPWDFSDLLNLILNRKVYIILGLNDYYLSNIENFQYVISEANKLSSQLNGLRINVKLHDGGHIFDPTLQKDAESFAASSCV